MASTRGDPVTSADATEPPEVPPTHRIVVEEPGLFTLFDGDQPGRHVFHMDNGYEQVEVVATLDALVVIAHNMLALVANERPTGAAGLAP